MKGYQGPVKPFPPTLLEIDGGYVVSCGPETEFERNIVAK